MSNIIEVTENDLIIQIGDCGGGGGSSAGVTSLNSLVGSINLIAGDGIEISSDGSSYITITSTVTGGGSATGSYVSYTQLFNTGQLLNNSIISLSGWSLAMSGFLQAAINTNSPSGFITTGNADSRYYSISNPSGYLNSLSGISSGYISGVSGVLQNQINNLLVNSITGFRTISGNGNIELQPTSDPDAYTRIRLLQLRDYVAADWGTLGFNNNRFIVERGTKSAQFNLDNLTASRTFTLPDKVGTVALLDDISSASGSILTTLNNSGQSLINYINNVSGNLNTKIFNSGQVLNTQIQDTGSLLISLITASSAGVSSLNGLTGIVNLSPAGNISITNTSSNIIVSGSVSGVIGGTGILVSSSNGNFIINTSGLVFSSQTGQFYPRNNPSGFVVYNDLYQTGSILSNLIQSNYIEIEDYINNVITPALNGNTAGLAQLSGNLFNSGQLLNTAIYNTGSLLSSVKVTGSNTINNANLSGQGSILVYYDNGLIVISGQVSSGSGGGGSSSGVSSINTLTNDLFITGAGNTTVTNNGNIIIVSGVVSSPSAPVFNLVKVDTNYLVTSNDYSVIYTGESLTGYITFPAASSVNLSVFNCKNATPTGFLIVSGFNETESFYTTGLVNLFSIDPGDSIQLHSDGVNYYVL